MTNHNPSHNLAKEITFQTPIVTGSGLNKTLLCLLIPLVLLIIPISWFHLDGLTIIQHRAIVVFALAIIFWIVEPIPIYATSMLIIFLMLVMMSDSGWTYLINNKDDQLFGSLMDYKEIMATLASPIIILFLGGFFLSIAATKYHLDQQMAKVFISPFGTNPKYVMLGVMTVTALFSMFMSNTATTAMMLAIIMPLLSSMENDDRGKIGMVLSVPVSANLGGIGTPIGTPPNAIALKYLSGYDINFSKWMMLGVPIVIILIIFSWSLINAIFPISSQSIQIKANDLAPKNHHKPKLIVYVTFAITVLLWLTDFLHGMNAYVISVLPIVIFLCLGVLDKDDLKLISWDVLWLVSGGLALGLALSTTGLAETVVSNIPFNKVPTYAIIIGTAALGLIIANFMSNTATANIFIPLVAVLAGSIPALREIGSPILLFSTTMAISLGMCLPISTPPNALAYSTGVIRSYDLTKVGLAVGAIGLITVLLILSLFKYLTFF